MRDQERPTLSECAPKLLGFEQASVGFVVGKFEPPDNDFSCGIDALGGICRVLWKVDSLQETDPIRRERINIEQEIPCVPSRVQEVDSMVDSKNNSGMISWL